MYKKKSIKYYVFLEQIDEIIRNNLLRFKNINVIINIKNIDQTNIKKTLSIIKFCKKNNVPFFYWTIISYVPNTIQTVFF